MQAAYATANLSTEAFPNKLGGNDWHTHLGGEYEQLPRGFHKMITLNHRALDLENLWQTAHRIHKHQLHTTVERIYNKLVDGRVAYLTRIKSLVIVNHLAVDKIVRTRSGRNVPSEMWKVLKQYKGASPDAKTWRKDSEVCKNCDYAEKKDGANGFTRYFCEGHLVSRGGACPAFELRAEEKRKVA